MLYIVLFAFMSYGFGLVVSDGWALVLGGMTAFLALAVYAVYVGRRIQAFHEDFERRAYGAPLTEEVGVYESSPAARSRRWPSSTPGRKR